MDTVLYPSEIYVSVTRLVLDHVLKKYHTHKQKVVNKCHWNA